MPVRSALVVMAATLLAAGCTNARPAANGTTTTTVAEPKVLTSVTPPGWVPIDYRDAQTSVPANWLVMYGPACQSYAQ